MIVEKIHKQLVSSRLLLCVILLAFIFLRLYPLEDNWDNLSLWGSLSIQIGIAFFLLYLNHKFGIIQGYTLLPAFFYLLFVGINPVFSDELKGSIAALCFILCYYFLFNSYQNPESQVNALNISLLLVLGSLVWTPLLFFFPLFWIGFRQFQCFNARVFFSSLTGFIIVYLFIFTYSVYKGEKDIILYLLPQLDSIFFFQKPDLTLIDWINYGFLLFIYFIIGIYLFLFDISERLWTITTLSYFYLSSFFIFVFFFLQTGYKSTWGLIIYIPLAFLCGHSFSSPNKRIIQFSFLFFIVFFIVIGVAQNINR